MILVVLVLALIVSVPLTGGQLQRLDDVHLVRGWAIALALGLQLLIIEVIPGVAIGVHVPLHLVSYVFAGVFFVANRHLPGLWLAGLGGFANFLAIAANGGRMPASVAALRTAGIEHTAGEFVNSGAVANARLAFLGDVFAIPASWPLANVYSLGDVAIVVGTGIALHRLCRARLMQGGPQAPAGLAPPHPSGPALFGLAVD
jgi:hypothetical protein